MSARAALALAVTLAFAVPAVACSGRNAAAPAAPDAAPDAAPAAAPAAAALTFAAGTPERALRDFCVANHEQFLACFEDDAFWDVLATMFFARHPTLDDGTPRTRQLWIGMRKDALAALARERRLAEDCETALRHSLWPTEKTVARVVEARTAGCLPFANAFGKMVFVDGAFSEQR